MLKTKIETIRKLKNAKNNKSKMISQCGDLPRDGALRIENQKFENIKKVAATSAI